MLYMLVLRGVAVTAKTELLFTCLINLLPNVSVRISAVKQQQQQEEEKYLSSMLKVKSFLLIIIGVCTLYLDIITCLLLNNILSYFWEARKYPQLQVYF